MHAVITGPQDREHAAAGLFSGFMNGRPPGP